MYLSPSLWFLGRGSSGRGSVYTECGAAGMITMRFCDSAVRRGHCRGCVSVYMWVWGQLYVSNVKFQRAGLCVGGFCE